MERHGAVERSVKPVAIVAALSGRYTVSTGPTRTLRRTMLDTFDRRLRGAGLTLEHQKSASGETLVLEGAGATPTISAPVTDQHWPALADALPMGPLRDAIGAVTGVRALMVTSDERRRVQELVLRNEEAKIVARVEVDAPVTVSAAPARVRVHPLRGYGAEARRVSRLLAGLDLPAPENRAGTTDGTGGTGGTGGDSAEKATAERSRPATALLTAALRDFLTAMRENLPGLIDDVDTEFLHDFRVAVRRTRATLKLGRPCLPEAMCSQWEPAFKGLGDLTTPVRDLDVYGLGLPSMRRRLLTADPADLEPLAAHLRRRRAAEHRALLRGLRSARFRRLLRDWDHELTELTVQVELGDAQGGQDDEHLEPDGKVDPPAVEDGLNLSAGWLADRAVSTAYRRVARDGAAISGDSPAQDLHTLRKRCKELRYALEVWAPVIPKAARRRAVEDLKDLQDVLGRFQDAEVQRHALRTFAEEMLADGTSTEAVLAMGELIAQLDSEQDRARSEFDDTFARFARPSSQQLMQRLGGHT